MAGRPMQRRMLAELERRAAEAGETEDGQPRTAIDVVCDWIADGKFIAELARELTDAVGQPISAGVISLWINASHERKAKVAAARALAAHVHAEDSLKVLDDLEGTEVTREEVALAKERSATRQWLASKWNRGQYGADAQVQITNINAADAHLAALAQRKQIQAKAQAQLAPADDADYEVIPAGSEDKHEDSGDR